MTNPYDDDRDDDDARGTLNMAAVLKAWASAARRVAGTFLRPVPGLAGMPAEAAEDGGLAQAARGFPVVGFGLGLAGALVLLLARALGLPTMVAAAIALAFTAFATGAIFETGLARFAPAVAAGGGKAAVLAAMRERAPGYFGILTLIVVFAIKFGALSVLSGRGAAAALIAAETAAWASLPALLYYLDPATDRGLAARAGRPRFEEAALAAAFGAAVALLFLGPWVGIVALAVGAGGAFKIAWLARRGVGGVTGAVLGAGHQAVVTGVLIATAALM